MAEDSMLARGRMTDERRALRRILGDMNGAPADDRAAAGAGAQLRQCHSNRHEDHPVHVTPAAWPVGRTQQMQSRAARASATRRECPKSAGFKAFRPKAAQLAGTSERGPGPPAGQSWLRFRENRRPPNRARGPIPAGPKWSKIFHPV
jgi:hypothetical protein